ncbi:nuclear transport factor 2 family protein [Agromyces sp. NPDC049794]|uniref:nuclear transport factor 2 family protein n=1 Tax=unclassified Agromyces TaxID=2639701 RepID=UPI0033FBAC61
MTSLEERLARVEDQLAIFQLISAYGPAVDAGMTGAAVSQWARDGVYSVDGIGEYRGPRELAELFDAELHQRYIHTGSAHVNSLPHVLIDGDRAVATNYQQLYIWSGKDARVMRSVATRWEFVRTADGWKVETRTNALLDGRDVGRSLLARANEPPQNA